MSMNIGIFSDTYAPQISGVATSIKQLSNELRSKGHKVYIFTPSDPKAEPEDDLFRLPSVPFLFLRSHRLTYIYPPQLLVKLARLNLDIVHTQTEFPLGFLGKATSDVLRIPLVHTYHTMYENYTHYVMGGHVVTPKMAQTFSRVFCNRADAVIVPSDKTRASLIEYGVKKPISAIPTGLDFSPFERGRYTDEEIQAEREALGIEPNAPLIVTIGRVAKEKSIEVIVRAMPKLLERLPNARFAVVGDGPVREDLEKMAHSLGVGHAVLFAGPKPWEQIGKFYQMGDVFVTASTSEAQGLTYMESIAAQTPVVVKRDECITGIVKDNETGYIFDTDEECADTLFRALTDTENRKQITDRAFAAISGMSSKAFGERVNALYEQVIESKRTKRGRVRMSRD